IEYLGRNDDQVKIRGFRVELGEIEAELLRCEEVKRALVVARDDVSGQKRLVAYIEPRSGCPIETDELRRSLKSRLPAHMLPSAFVALEHFPLTPTGKVDKGALPALGASAHARHEYEAPQGTREQTIARIWAEL